MWFEPPLVCRWEITAETKISEELENGINVSNKHRRASKHFHKNRKIISDFNLLDIPSGLDLFCLMQEFVIPRLPNGYTVKVGTIVLERKNSILNNPIFGIQI